ncbi:4-hydroxy-tetrahydrodipicolinate reductase [Enterococcus sp. CSURQ0835]|uniref:4-hydroxy-tetrahydrodipicolinate reductase n=1 Tax=Enterococcus sp. CSURQ0835 TaxID=2681394 RepID=UPI00135AC2CE|nr:4-hydroxy-tetrahydrodipicolinate reductase [Enterococcus sp. CSURQ0835]
MKVIIIGPHGNMGQWITRIANERKDFEIVGAVGPKGRDYIGQDLGQVARVGQDLKILVTDELEKVIMQGDVIIDFSTREMSLDVLRLAVAYQVPLVCGTTGFSSEEKARFTKAGEKIPVLLAANTSRFVYILRQLVAEATEQIGKQSDIEIVEMHDRWKKDAPSGTAEELGEVIAGKLGTDLAELAVYDRHQQTQRHEHEIGYHSLRLGNASSSHSVYFGGIGERLELTHHSYDFSSFAKGACDCAAFLVKQSVSNYTVEDVFKN